MLKSGVFFAFTRCGLTMFCMGAHSGMMGNFPCICMLLTVQFSRGNMDGKALLSVYLLFMLLWCGDVAVL